MAEVCIDAGLAIKAVVPEQDSEQTTELFRRWRHSGVRLIAPAFFFVEVDSILSKKARVTRTLTEDAAERALLELKLLPIERLDLELQRDLAWSIARRFGMSTVYDATYLALAQLRVCEFWTADDRLWKRVREDLPFIPHLSEVV